MGKYLTTRKELESRFGELLEGLDVSRVQVLAAIRSADETIETNLAGADLSGLDETVRERRKQNACEVLAAYRLGLAHGTVRQDVQAAYDGVQEFLAQARRGEFGAQGAAGG